MVRIIHIRKYRKIYGFEENSLGRTQELADHSLVFVVRGIVKILNSLFVLFFEKHDK